MCVSCSLFIKLWLQHLKCDVYFKNTDAHWLIHSQQCTTHLQKFHYYYQYPKGESCSTHTTAQATTYMRSSLLEPAQNNNFLSFFFQYDWK